MVAAPAVAHALNVSIRVMTAALVTNDHAKVAFYWLWAVALGGNVFPWTATDVSGGQLFCGHVNVRTDSKSRPARSMNVVEQPEGQIFTNIIGIGTHVVLSTEPLVSLAASPQLPAKLVSFGTSVVAVVTTFSSSSSSASSQATLSGSGPSSTGALVMRTIHRRLLHAPSTVVTAHSFSSAQGSNTRRITHHPIVRVLCFFGARAEIRAT